MLRLPLFQEAELQRVQKVRELELAYARSQLELEVSKAQQLAEVEVNKFKQMTEALGPSTIRDLAVAGPEMQVRLRREQESVSLGTILGTQKAALGAGGLGEAEMGQAYTHARCPLLGTALAPSGMDRKQLSHQSVVSALKEVRWVLLDGLGRAALRRGYLRSV